MVKALLEAGADARAALAKDTSTWAEGETPLASALRGLATLNPKHGSAAGRAKCARLLSYDLECSLVWPWLGNGMALEGARPNQTIIESSRAGSASGQTEPFTSYYL